MTSQSKSESEIALRRKRMRYRAWHRGTQEMDLVLGHFADAHFDAYDNSELDRIEILMEESDAELLAWITRQETPPETIDAALLDELRDFQQRRNLSS